MYQYQELLLLWAQLRDYSDSAFFWKRLNNTEGFMLKVLYFISNWRKYLHKNYRGCVRKIKNIKIIKSYQWYLKFM
jgi:hypothetical protein